MFFRAYLFTPEIYCGESLTYTRCCGYNGIGISPPFIQTYNQFSYYRVGAVYPPQSLMKRSYDIREHNNILDEINAVINGGEVAEVKIEYKEGVPSLKVVRIVRKVVASSN